MSIAVSALPVLRKAEGKGGTGFGAEIFQLSFKRLEIFMKGQSLIDRYPLFY